MMEGYCIACQYGQHDEHIDYPEKPSKGVMGGWHCPCNGECVDEYAKRHRVIADAETRYA